MNATLAMEYLRQRGIYPETVSDNNVEILTRVIPSEYRFRLRFDQWHSGPLHEIIEESIWFPCMDAGTTIQSWIVRPFPTLPSENGSGVKFLTPKEGNNFPFIPAATWAV